jgi:hypothetical protein
MYVELQSAAAASITSDGTDDSCWVAERAISSVEMSIGGQRVD